VDKNLGRTETALYISAGDPHLALVGHVAGHRVDVGKPLRKGIDELR
jgi:hypothetical protein